ncbi:energy transducer TonB, partial [Marichromatium gracile]|uniref:energy transducer TonB n=2 Tax=Marichromatium TaxID=85076 RepID=UPI001F5B7724
SRPRHAAPPATRDAAPARETGAGRAAGGRATQTTPDQPVAYLHTPRPAYPARARRLGQHGEVTLEVLVGRDGRAEEIRLAHSSGVESLDRAARETVAHWRFRPARVDGAARASWVRIPVRFTLNH